ncbi:MAG: PAS domain-containing sensor histidine kinase [Desulfovibrio sp.]|nr:PAS domain-containing sensor histidine kinase [Desulfovibrio sp.]MCA1985779.1 PAS domain-containing sensor histidine kinase [Desulfovibrio sp.]
MDKPKGPSSSASAAASFARIPASRGVLILKAAIILGWLLLVLYAIILNTFGILWNEILSYSLILPILLAATTWGRLGGLGVALAAGLVAGAPVVGHTSPELPSSIYRFTYQFILFHCIGFSVALLWERSRLSQENLTRFFEGLPVGIFRWSFEHKLTVANPALLHMLGYEDLRSLQADHIDHLLIPSDRLEEWNATFRAGNTPGPLITQLQRKDGRQIWVKIVSRISADPVTGELCYEGAVEDVTERMEADASLRQLNRQLQDIIEFLPDATFVVDANRRIVFWNKAMEEMTGRSKQEMLGKSNIEYSLAFYREPKPLLIDLFFDPQPEASLRYRALERRGETYIADVFVPHLAGGRGAHVHGIASPLRDENGTLIGAIESIRDITQRVAAEEALRSARDEMERQVEARTAELRLANARLQEMDQLKSLFLSSASHELRTPLTSVLGFVKLIQRDLTRHLLPLTEGIPQAEVKARRVLDNLAIIETEGARLARLVNDLLDLNKIESGSMEWRDQPLDVHELIQKAVEALSPQVAARPGLSLELDLQHNLPTIVADADRMAQVLVNLLSNAVKFTPQGVIRVHARTESQASLLIRVQDSGVGIPKASLPHIFNKFYQTEEAALLPSSMRGSGLGLTICRQIVEHYGGRIWAESEPGKGATFLVRLPLGCATTLSGMPVTERPQ